MLLFVVAAGSLVCAPMQGLTTLPFPSPHPPKLSPRNKQLLQNAGFKVYIIHSEIPLEEQQEAFLPVDSKHVKVVIATNAAESSITIPDVDIVVCLGTSKSVQYNSNTHLSYIQNSWISKASGECTHSIQ